jgi:hypothetical protein
MKRTMILMPLLVASLTFLSSCKKEYTCTCTVITTVSEHDYYESNGQQQEDVTTEPPTTSTQEVTTDKVKKGDAESACASEGGTTESQIGGTVIIDGFKEGIVEKTTRNSTCKLK